MKSFLNKDIDLRNKTQEEFQETLLTKTQFNPKLEPETQSTFSPLKVDDDKRNSIFIIVVKISEKKYKIFYSFSGNEDSFVELNKNTVTKIRTDFTKNLILLI